MSKHLIFTFSKMSHRSMLPSQRIAEYLSRMIGVPIVSDESIAAEPLDCLVIVNGNYAFTKKNVLAALGSSVESARRVVWVQNDYTIYPPTHEGSAQSPFRAAFRRRHERGMPLVDFWSTIKCMTRPGVTAIAKRLAGPESAYLDWNVLTYEPRETSPIPDRQYGESMIYYGSYRTDRAIYFDSYFRDPQCDVVVSSPSKKFEKYESSERVFVIPKIPNLSRSLETFGAGLYVEDRRSHRIYMSPANRFYEMLCAGVAICFQPESARTFSHAGIDIRDWTRRPSELGEFVRDANMIAVEQRNRLSELCRLRRADLDADVMSAWRSIQ